MSHAEDNTGTRRDFLYYATAGAGAVATGAAVWPLVNQMNPSADVQALASIFVDVSGVEVGTQLTVKYLGKPVFIRRRTPEEIEEAAIIDGCSQWGVFWRIVFPLLKPITVTIVILNTLWIWNDFLLPSLMLRDVELRTIPLATFYFFGQYTKQWDLALAGLILGIIPLLLFFFAMQKQIIQGITSGSIK